MKNKGFSLVELIIVIAIMAILAAAIAPALIRYIDKSRRSDDVAAAETLNTATQAALANEDAYDEIQSTIASAGSSGIAIASAAQGSSFAASISCPTFLEEINSSTANKAPSIKYKKNGASSWKVGVNDAGKPVVWIVTSGGDLELQPSIHKTYK